MQKLLRTAVISLLFSAMALGHAAAAPAADVLGRDFTFPNRIEGLFAKLSDFKDLQIYEFRTNDGVKLAYWEAGKGRPVVLIRGWPANGAEYINVMYLLSQRYHVYVLDPRNQGLSQKVDYGTRISRYAADLKDFAVHLRLESADFVGWPMGASVIWAYIDLYGSAGMRKTVFIDEPISIYIHADWTEQERLNTGAITSSPERIIAASRQAQTNSLYLESQAFGRATMTDSLAFVNSVSFAQAFIRTVRSTRRWFCSTTPTNDWRDVVQRKITTPAAIFTGEFSDSLPAHKWLHSVMPGSTLHVYSAAEQGDHFLAFKNPVKFTQDLQRFLDR